jgi:VanZ family protein
MLSIQKYPKWLLRLPALLIVITLWILSSRSALPTVGTELPIDKLEHLIAYTVLGFSIGLWISADFWKRHFRIAVLLVTIIGSAYGLTDEIHQYFTPNRSSDILDWTADTVGSFLGAMTLMLVLRKPEQRKPAEAAK